MCVQWYCGGLFWLVCGIWCFSGGDCWIGDCCMCCVFWCGVVFCYYEVVLFCVVVFVWYVVCVVFVVVCVGYYVSVYWYCVFGFLVDCGVIFDGYVWAFDWVSGVVWFCWCCGCVGCEYCWVIVGLCCVWLYCSGWCVVYGSDVCCDGVVFVIVDCYCDWYVYF